MKILWVADFALRHTIGGAQRSDALHISEGIQRGHNIVSFNYDSPRELLAREYDVVVSANMENLHRDPAVWDKVVDHGRHIRCEHDSNSYLTINMRRELFGSTRHSCFLSEFHLSEFQRMYGNIFYNTTIVSDPIDTDIFCNHNITRQDRTLYIGYLHQLKGVQVFLNHVLDNPTELFAVAGWGAPQLERAIKSFDNVEWLGQYDYKDMPLLLNGFSRMFYKPVKFEPFCRSVAEAILCGVELDVGDNIGSVHEYNRVGLEKFTRNCKEASRNFWDLIENDKLTVSD